MGSRDLRRIYAIDPRKWEVLEEKESPGIPWAAVATNGTLCFTIGEDPDDDRYIRRFGSDVGFSEADKIACPDRTVRAGPSRGSIRERKSRRLKTSQSCHSRAARLPSMARTFGRIIVPRMKSCHLHCRGRLSRCLGPRSFDLCILREFLSKSRMFVGHYSVAFALKER